MMEAQPLAQPQNADGILQVDLVNQRVHHPVEKVIALEDLEIVSYHAGCDVACLWGNAPTLACGRTGIQMSFIDVCNLQLWCGASVLYSPKGALTTGPISTCLEKVCSIPYCIDVFSRCPAIHLM